MRAVALQEQAAGYGKPDEPICEVVHLLRDIHFPIIDAFSGAATPEAVLVLLAYGVSGWRVWKWDHCEGRRGHWICFVEGCGSKRSPNYRDGDCRAGDDLWDIPAVQSVHSQWKVLSGKCLGGKCLYDDSPSDWGPLNT